MRARELVTTLNAIRKRDSKLLMLKQIKEFCNNRKIEKKYLKLTEGKFIINDLYDSPNPGRSIVNKLIEEGYITNVKLQ